VLCKHWSRIEPRAPKVIQADEAQSRQCYRAIPKNIYTGISGDARYLIRHIEHSPSAAVVVVAKDANGSQASARHVRQNAEQLLELAFVAIADPIASADHKIR
jgi:hypothetical protein